MKAKLIWTFSILFIIISTFVTANAQSEEYIVKFYDDYRVPQKISNQLDTVLKSKNIYLVKDIMLLDGLEEHIESKVPNKKVSLIAPEKKIYPQLFSTESDTWQFDMIEASYAHNLEAYGNEVRVAVIDTGCYPHSEFSDNIVATKNYFDETEDVTDNNGHGTHLAGIIASKINDTGITGVAPRVKLVILKSIDSGEEATLYQVFMPIIEAVDVYGCRVINISWGVAGSDLDSEDMAVFKEIVDYAASMGTIIVSAVGNGGGSDLSYPAAFDNVIGVGSVGSNKEKSASSRVNESVTVVAPGENVNSTSNDGNYKILSGTSQAAPFVSGMAAVALSIKNNLSFDEFKNILTNSCEDLGDKGYDTSYGYGLVNEKNMINILIKNMDTYISPISDGTALVLNNSDNKISGIGIWAEYDSYGNYIKSSTENISLEPSKSTKTVAFKTNNALKFFLWDSLESLTPLSVSRDQSASGN